MPHGWLTHRLRCGSVMYPGSAEMKRASTRYIVQAARSGIPVQPSAPFRGGGSRRVVRWLLLLVALATTQARAASDSLLRCPPSPTPSSAATPRHARQALSLEVSAGPCQVVGDCVRSLGYPNSNYGPNEACTISNVPASPISVSGFDVESHNSCAYDFLTINAVKYCDTSGPAGIVAEDGTILWESDGSGEKAGWELCWPKPPSMPPAPPPASPPPPTPPAPPPPSLLPPQETLYAAPNFAGSVCDEQSPCDIDQVLDVARDDRADSLVVIMLAAGR